MNGADGDPDDNALEDVADAEALKVATADDGAVTVDAANESGFVDFDW